MISIIMPLYNGLEFLQESVNSIINQTVQEWELIIVINGLTALKTNDVIRQIVKFQDKRIKYCKINKRGKVKALNKGATSAKYDILALIDVDDIWEITKLEEQLKYIKSYDVVGCDVEYFGDHTGSPGLFLGKLIKPMFTWQNPLINSMIMIRKSNAFWDESWEGLDDYNLWIYLLNNRKSFYNVPKILGKHRIHKESFFNNKNAKLYKALKEKLKPLTEEEKDQLTHIIDTKEWL